MALINRIKDSKSNNLIHHCKKYYSHLTTAPQFTNQNSSLNKLLLLPNYHFVTNSFNFESVYKCPHDFLCFKVRFFAAPIQFKKKVEEIKPNRPRLNDEIKAQFFRLVTDEGHSVVSLNKALDLAKSLDLDLVEVDSDAKPPVCKIYDFNLAKYKKQIRLKERAKLKAAEGIKKGNPKEVRVSAKAELKDLKMKADTVKRLVERGYRVKCTAIGSEDEDLCGLLTKLSALIEDVAFVEFGPSMDSKQPHMVVRHIKFASGKKGVKKASKDRTSTNPDIQGIVTNVVGEEFDEESDSNDDDDEVDVPSCSANLVSSTDQSFNKIYNVGHDVKGATSPHDDRVQFKTGTIASTEYVSGCSPGVPSNNSNVRQETENRYARSAAKNSSAVRNPMRFPNNGSHPQPPSSPQHQPHPRLSVAPRNNPQQSGRQGHQTTNTAGDLRSHATNFGAFSNPKSDHPSDATRIPGQGVVPRNLNPPPPKSDAPHNSESAEKKFGIFSR